jgi:hypothetical protein
MASFPLVKRRVDTKDSVFSGVSTNWGTTLPAVKIPRIGMRFAGLVVIATVRISATLGGSGITYALEKWSNLAKNIKVTASERKADGSTARRSLVEAPGAALLRAAAYTQGRIRATNQDYALKTAVASDVIRIEYPVMIEDVNSPESIRHVCSVPDAVLTEDIELEIQVANKVSATEPAIMSAGTFINTLAGYDGVQFEVVALYRNAPYTPNSQSVGYLKSETKISIAKPTVTGSAYALEVKDSGLLNWALLTTFADDAHTGTAHVNPSSADTDLITVKQGDRDVSILTQQQWREQSKANMDERYAATIFFDNPSPLFFSLASDDDPDDWNMPGSRMLAEGFKVVINSPASTTRPLELMTRRDLSAALE